MPRRVRPLTPSPGRRAVPGTTKKPPQCVRRLPAGPRGGASLQIAQLSLYLFPCERGLGRWMVEQPIELSLVPLGHRDRVRAGGEAVPNVFDGLEALLRWQLENLVEECFRRHAIQDGEVVPRGQGARAVGFRGI